MHNGIFAFCLAAFLGHLIVGAFSWIACLIFKIEYTFSTSTAIWIALMVCIVLANMMADLVRGNDGRR